jgi:heat shock protein HtpX
MQFFEHQRRARSQSQKLTLLFALLLVGQIIFINITLAIPVMLITWLSQPASSSAVLGVMHLLPKYFVQTNTIMVLMYVIGGWWIESSNLSGGGEQLAKSVGARQLRHSPNSHTISLHDNVQIQLANIVQELSIASKMRVPSIYVLPRQSAINAFTAGWNEDDSVICVTQGALDCLEREELMGLVAHELSHIQEGDTRLNMRLAGMVLGLEIIYNLGQSLVARTSPVLKCFGYLLKFPGWINWICARLMKAAISREREFLADASAVQFTRNQEGLGCTLRKVAWQQDQLGYESLLNHPAVQHMLLVEDDLNIQDRLRSHPPLTERIERIYGGPMPNIEAKLSGRQAWKNPFAQESTSSRTCT